MSGSSLTVFTDHKPLVGVAKNSTAIWSDKQQRQLAFINEYTNDIVYVAGRDNVVADTLSRNVPEQDNIAAVTIAEEMPIDIIAIAKQQANSDEDLSEYEEFDVGAQDIKLHCNTNQPNPRPVVPPQLRRKIHDTFHNLSHPGWKATCRLVGSRYFWPTLISKSGQVNVRQVRLLRSIDTRRDRWENCLALQRDSPQCTSTWLVLYRITKAYQDIC